MDAQGHSRADGSLRITGRSVGRGAGPAQGMGLTHTASRARLGGFPGSQNKLRHETQSRVLFFLLQYDKRYQGARCRENVSLCTVGGRVSQPTQIFLEGNLAMFTEMITVSAL